MTDHQPTARLRAVLDDPELVASIKRGVEEAKAGLATPVDWSRLDVIDEVHLLPDQDPELNVRVDAIEDRYMRLHSTTDAAEWLSTQLEHFRGELETNENQLHEFKKSNDLPSSTPDEVSKMIRLEMQHYDEALTRTRTRKQELQARVAELNKVTQNPEQLPASELLGNAFLTSLRGQYQNAQRERRELLAVDQRLLTQGDTEVLLAGHQHMPRQIQGHAAQFAERLLDRLSHEVFWKKE